MSGTRVVRTGRLVLACVGGLVLGAPSAGAGPEPLPDAVHRRAEDAFVVGRLDDLDAILGTGTAAVDLEPLAVRDLFWRPTDPRPTLPVAADDRGLSARRVTWLGRLALQRTGGAEVRSPYPGPEANETDAYPRLTALVRDRLRRESVGARGLPRESPLSGISDPDIEAFQTWYARRAYEGPLDTDLPEEDRRAEAAQRAQVAEIGARNVRLGVGALLVLVVGAWLGGRILGGRRKNGRRGAERSEEEPGS